MKERIRKICLICGKEFQVIPSRKDTAKYCSKKCLRKSKMGKKNTNWMGDNVNYQGVHAWVRKCKGKPKICEICGSTAYIDWANKHHTYKRRLDDYISLCRSCHMKYDIKKGQRINNIKIWKTKQLATAFVVKPKEKLKILR